MDVFEREKQALKKLRTLQLGEEFNNRDILYSVPCYYINSDGSYCKDRDLIRSSSLKNENKIYEKVEESLLYTDGETIITIYKVTKDEIVEVIEEFDSERKCQFICGKFYML